MDSLFEKYKSTGLVLNKKVMVGGVADEIETVALIEKFDLIVMGKSEMSAVKRFFVGSNTRKIVAVAPCFVLIVKE